MHHEQTHRAGRCLRRVYVDDDITATKPRVIRPAFTLLACFGVVLLMLGRRRKPLIGYARS